MPMLIFFIEYAKGCQVDTIGIKRSKGQKTGQAYIFVQEDGDSMITIMSGANNSITPQDIINNERLFTNASFCMMQTEIPMEAVIKAAELAKKHGLTTVLKPSACTFLPTKLLKLIDILVPNLDELNEICPSSDSMEEKTSFLLSKGHPNSYRNSWFQRLLHPFPGIFLLTPGI